jgi:uncharacterized protein (TIGR04222 family)
VLLGAALLIRFPVVRGAGRDLRPTEVALLRSGPRAAVVTALVLLHARAAVDVAAPGAVRRSGALPHGCDPLARLVYESLARPGGPRELAARGPVRGGLDRLAAGLAGAGLVLSAWRRLALRALAALAALVGAAGLASTAVAAGAHRAPAVAALVGPALAVAALALLPARTAAGRRLVRRLRWRHAHLTPEHEPDAAEWSPQVLGLAVALHGEAALRLTFPRFAAQGGLLGRRAPGWRKGGGRAGGGREPGGRGPAGPEGPARQWPRRGRTARQRQRRGRARYRSNLPPAGARRGTGPVSPGS